MKKFLSLILCISVFHMTGCFVIEELFKQGPIMKYGDFLYCYVNDADDNRRKGDGKYVAILELAEDAKKKETIIIPETIEGKPVILIGMEGIGWSTNIEGDFNKIYLPISLEQIRKQGQFKLDIKRFLINMPNEEFLKNIYGNFYVSEKDYIKYKEYFEKNESDYELEYIKIANLTYIVDDEIYWIDDYNNKDRIVFPTSPEKEKYIFVGWYTEPECINRWDEKTNMYTKAENIASVKLYAKWIEN